MLPQHQSTTRNVTVVLGAAVLALFLAACGTSPQSESYPDLSLAETKSPTQLLRNEAASRIPVEFIEVVDHAQDLSKGCQTPERDPEGLIRSWNSSVRVSLKSERGAQLDTIVDELVKSFELQGWDRGTFGGATIIELTSSDSPVNIHISSVQPDDSGAGAKIQLSAGGPCVETDGADSDEILQLEGRSE
jgi:hypothetical protein